MAVPDATARRLRTYHVTATEPQMLASHSRRTSIFMTVAVGCVANAAGLVLAASAALGWTPALQMLITYEAPALALAALLCFFTAYREHCERRLLMRTIEREHSIT